MADCQPEFSGVRRLICHDQAARYLQLFNRELDAFEEHLHEWLADSIDDDPGD